MPAILDITAKAIVCPEEVRVMFAKAWGQSNGNHTKAAAMLGLNRRTYYRLLHRLWPVKKSSPTASPPRNGADER